MFMRLAHVNLALVVGFVNIYKYVRIPVRRAHFSQLTSFNRKHFEQLMNDLQILLEVLSG